METKFFYGVEFKVYSDKKIEGDFIRENEAVYFENDVEITGNLKVKYLKTEKSINVHKNYEVEKWEEVGGSQEVGEFQKVGWSQKVGGSQEVGEYQKVGGDQKVGGSQEVGEYQKVGGDQKVGWSQEVGGDATIRAGINVGLSINVKGTLKFGKRLFAGICSWRDITEEEKTITCGKLEGGEVVHGIVKETGLEDKSEEKETEIIELNGKKYKRI